MILDNEKYRKVHEWMTKYTEEGTVDIVTGYFTVGALAYLSQQINHKIAKFRLVLGDIVNLDQVENRPLDLLNENITIEAALNLSLLAQEAVIFLRQDKVKVKTLEPNFCHAKCYLFEPLKDDDRNKYFISGSSNLTEAGIGLKHTNNLELNIAETGNNHQYKELVKWFDSLWHKPQAHQEKTLLLKDGTTEKVDFKQYLIHEIEKIFIKYTPRDIYYKILFELFGNQVLEIENDPDFNRQVGRLENTAIFTALYDFQKKGVLSLIRMLQKYNGAILADAVGLGKTWSALAVIKFFQMQGREVILLCPKKLESNWRRYKEDQASKFETDKLKFFIRFHTDMNSDRLNSYHDRADKFFCDDKPKLIVIDESHNLRNDKSNRYKFLVDQILKKNQDIKVLLISATPINNSLNDVRNQFKLMVQGDVHGYDSKLGVKNIDYSFKQAQTIFNEWRRDTKPQIGNFIKKLSDNDFFRLTDSLLVARTRKMVESQQTNLLFPTKNKPKNLFVTPHQLGNFETFEELFDHFPPMLSGYQPAFYMVINYDIHWNPVRIIQRMGRIDRLGSPNQEIFGINFWPSDNINSYLNLQGRIEQRMATMKLAGAEVDHQFSDSFAKMVHDEEFDQKMNDLMMQQMQVTWDDIEVSDQGLGFDSLSLERYRQDLLAEFNRDKDKYRQMPKGVYTGFAAEQKSGVSDDLSDGIIALLGYPAKPAKKLDHQYQVFDLIYIDKSGKLILKNQKEVLDLLTLYKDNERFVPDAIDRGEAVVIAELVNALKTWLSSQAVQTEEMEDGSIKETMGNETLGILQGLKKGNKASIDRIKQNVTVDGKYQLNNFDLISWVLVTV